jgi:hypothetical protein
MSSGKALGQPSTAEDRFRPSCRLQRGSLTLLAHTLPTRFPACAFAVRSYPPDNAATLVIPGMSDSP